MKIISIKEYNALMNFMESKLKSLWNHENEEREKQGKELINVFQFGFSILDINHYYIDENCDFYIVFNSSFLKMISSSILDATKKYPNKFGTGDAEDVIDALYNTSGYKYWGTKQDYINFLTGHACCYVVYQDNGIFSDILRIDMFRSTMPNKEDPTKIDFVGGLLHTLKHFSIKDQNLSTGTYIYNIFDIRHIIYLIGMAFRLKKGEGTKYKSLQQLTNAIMLASFYKEEVTGIFFLNSYYKKKSIS